MKKLCFILLAICLIAIACEEIEPTIKDNGNNSIEAILKMNETFIVPNNAMTISFVEVSDDRCPKSTCHLCYGSKADISLSIINSKSKSVDIELNIVGCVDELQGDNLDTYPCGKGVDTLGYRFQLLKLSPYPDVEPINKDDYVAKIKITKLF